MKKYVVLMPSIVLSLALSSVYCAEAETSKKAFDGFGVQLGLGVSRGDSPITTSYSDLLQDDATWNDGDSDNIIDSGELTYTSMNADDSFTLSDNNVTGLIAASYARSMREYSLGLNIFYHIGSQSYGSGQLDKLSTYAAAIIADAAADAAAINGAQPNTIPNVTGDGIVTGQVKLKNLYGAAIEPGYYIQDKLLTYAKLGAAWTSPELAISGGVSDGALDTTVKFGSTLGFLYGVGVKYAVTDNWYVGAEAYQVKFPTKTETTDFSGYYTGSGEANENTTVTYQFKDTYTYGGVVIGYQF